MSGPGEAAQIQTRAADRLTERLAPDGWRQHSFVPDDEVAFVREPCAGVVFHLSVNLAGGDGLSLDSSVGVEHVAAAELHRQLFGHTGAVCQVGATMINLVHDADPSGSSPLRWWVGAPEQVDEAVDQVVADVKAHGEPFLFGNQTLPAVIETLLAKPKSQVEYATLAICRAVSGDLSEARAMLAEFGAARQVFAGGATETFIRNFTSRFGT